MSLLDRVRAKARALVARLLREHASPRQIGWAIGVGAFVGCTPAVGLHGGIAVVVATALRLNKVWAFAGSRVSNILILPWIVLAEIQLSHRMRTGAFVPLRVDDALEQGRGLLLDWAIGSVPVGGALGVALGGAAYAVARFREKRRTLAPPPPPSSGSPG